MTAEDLEELFEGIKHVVREELDCLRAPLRRVLLVVLLDSLSGFRFPEESSNKERFVRLIATYSGSPYVDYVSLDQLQAQLTDVEGLSDLKTAIEAKIAKRPDPSAVCKPEEMDLRFKELRALDPSARAEKQIEMAQYASLLWKKRNLEIHEALRADRFDDYRGQTTPYHYPQEDGVKKWDLYFPTAFIAKLLDDCLDNLAREARAAAGQ